jgi:hypothetical protein
MPLLSNIPPDKKMMRSSRSGFAVTVNLAAAGLTDIMPARDCILGEAYELHLLIERERAAGVDGLVLGCVN